MAPTLPRRFCLSTSATWTSSSRRTPSSARCVHSRSPPHVGSRRPLRIASLARPPASAFSERTLNTSRRVARLLTTPLFFPRLPSLPSRARSGRSPRALSRRSWTSPTSERTRCAPLARPIRPHPPRATWHPPPDASFSHTSWAPRGRVAAAAPVFSESPTRGTFFPPSEKTDPLLLPSRSFPRPGMDRASEPSLAPARHVRGGPRGRRHRGTPRTPLSPPRPASPLPPRRIISRGARRRRGTPRSGHGRLRRRASTRHDGPREGGRGASVRHA